MLLPRLLAGTLSLAAVAHAAVANTTADTMAAEPQGGEAGKYPMCPPQVTVTRTLPAVTITKPAVTVTNTYTPPKVTVTQPAVTVTYTQPAGVKPTVTVTNTVTKPGGSVTVTTTKTTDGGYGGTT